MSYQTSETKQVPRVARALLVIGSLVRVSYGIGALLAPQRMVSAQLAPDTHDLAEPRLVLRAFGGHQLVAGSLTLCTIRLPRLAPAAATLSLAIDALDVASTLLEIGARGRCERQTVGGIALSGSGVLTFAAALGLLGR
jgi:uncharacterized protein YjeT (DUF2065 family)